MSGASYWELLRADYKLTLPVASSSVGLAVDLLGLFIVQSNAKVANQFGFVWTLYCFYLLWGILCLCSTIRQALPTYRLLHLAMTAMVIVFLFFDMDRAIGSTSDGVPGISTGSSVRFVGLFLFLVPVLVVFVYFGSESTGFYHRTAPAAAGMEDPSKDISESWSRRPLSRISEVTEPLSEAGNMNSFAVANLKQNFKYSALISIFAFGWAINFLGLIIAQASFGQQTLNALGLNWFWLFFYLFWILVAVYVVGTSSMKMYRLALLSLTTLVLAFIPFDIAGSLALTPALNGFAAGGGLKITGLLFCFFSMVKEDSVLHTADVSSLSFKLPSFRGEPRDSEMGPTKYQADSFNRPMSEQGPYTDPMVPRQVPELSMASPTPAPAVSTAAPVRVAQVEASSPLPSSPVARNSIRPDSIVMFKAKALYTYEANAADPNEISFAKGDILNVIDSKGKWWQVQKIEADGSFTSGIAPSNYLQSLA
ncbi:Transmembrane osmosensor [Kappamyces sp. JEL0680]|nr:Transmembrane osmosensor [Kappamyces sp. JEL0680]